MKRKVWISLCVLFCLAISGCTEIGQSDIADDTKGSSENSVFPYYEPWNNPEQKQYSRNLGREEGIELIYLSADKM